MNKTTTIFPILIFLISCQSTGDLEHQIQEKIDQFNGDAGVYLLHLERKDEIAINADMIFPTASMIKVPILVKVYDRIEKQELALDSVLIFYRDSINYPYKSDDAISRFAEGEDISINKLIAHMLIFSDNYASLWLQDLAGTGTAINEFLSTNGYESTRMNSRTEGRHGNWEQYGWGQTTPREMANLLISIREGTMVSQRASEDMYRNLCRTYWDGEALSRIPPEIQVASKQGAVSASKSEVLIINAPHGDIALCIITNNQDDTRWVSDNAGYVLIRDITELVWNYYESGFPWEPAPGIDDLH